MNTKVFIPLLNTALDSKVSPDCINCTTNIAKYGFNSPIFHLFIFITQVHTHIHIKFQIGCSLIDLLPEVKTVHKNYGDLFDYALMDLQLDRKCRGVYLFSKHFD